MAFQEQLPSTQSTDSMFLSKDRVKQIIQGAPQGTNPAGIVAGLREKGYTLEGYDQAQVSTQPTETLGKDIKKEPGFFSKVASNIGNFLSTAFTGVPSDIGVGMAKSVGSTAVGAAQLGQKVAEKIGIPTGQPIQQPEILQPKTPGEQIGKIAGDIGQFFIPGAQEEAAAGKIENIVNYAKFAEQHGAKAAEALKGILGIVGKGLSGMVSASGVTALQTGGDVGKTETAGILGFAGGAASKALEIFGPGLAKSVEKANFKLTPSQETKLANKIDQASSFITENKISGSETSKYRKLTDINNQLEDAIQSSVGKDVSIKTSDLEAELKAIPESFKQDKAIYQQVKKESEEAIKTLRETEKDTITADSLLAGKRSYSKSAFGKGQSQIKGSNVISEGDYAIEQAYQNTLEKAMSQADKQISVPSKLQKYFGGKSEVSLPEFNKTYSQAISAKKFTNAAQFKKDTGLVGRLFGLWAGEAIGQTIAPGIGGKLVGGAVGEIASSRLPGAIRGVAQRAAYLPESTPAFIAKATQAEVNQPDIGQSSP